MTKTGDFASFIATNIGLGQKASLLWAVNAGRFSQTAGLFLLGFYLGRKQMFAATDTNLRRWVGLLVVSALAFAPLYSLRDLAMGGEPMVRQTVGTAFDMWQKLAFAFVLVAYSLSAMACMMRPSSSSHSSGLSLSSAFVASRPWASLDPL